MGFVRHEKKLSCLYVVLGGLAGGLDGFVVVDVPRRCPPLGASVLRQIGCGRSGVDRSAVFSPKRIRHSFEGSDFRIYCTLCFLTGVVHNILSDSLVAVGLGVPEPENEKR